MSRRRAKTSRVVTKSISTLPQITLSFANGSSVKSRSTKRRRTDAVKTNVIARDATRVGVLIPEDYWLPNSDPDCVAESSASPLITNARRRGKVTCPYFFYWLTLMGNMHRHNTTSSPNGRNIKKNTYQSWSPMKHLPSVSSHVDVGRVLMPFSPVITATGQQRNAISVFWSHIAGFLSIG